MEVAIHQIMSGTTHRWCKWHVLRKAKEHLGPHYMKRSDFRAHLHKVVNEMLSIDEFESAWGGLLDKYSLRNNTFLIQIFEVRHKWAKPYFSGKFCAKTTSTQRSESANHLLKGYIPPACSMNLFVKQYSKLQFDREAEEGFQEKRTRAGSFSDIISHWRSMQVRCTPGSCMKCLVSFYTAPGDMMLRRWSEG